MSYQILQETPQVIWLLCLRGDRGLCYPVNTVASPSHSTIRSLDNREDSSTIMDSCVLHPPTQFLSDNVITGVVQRTRKVSANHQWAPPSPKWQRQDTGNTGNSELMMLAHSSHDAAKKSAEDALANVVTQDWFIEQQKHQREIRRVRQIRYRKKQQDYMTTLEENNRELQHEILQLEKRRRAISASAPTEKTLWNVAVEYFRVFRYGFRASDLAENNSSVQLDFLRSSMAPDVLYNAGRGVEAILKNWTYFSLWFQDVEVQLDGLKKHGQESLIAKTTTTFIITEKTVANVFPHLNGQDGDGVLASKLLGQKIVLNGSTRFDWDSGYGRVTSVISESDMLTPMLRVLGSLEDVSKVFEKSLISLTPYRGQMRMRG